MEPVSAMSAHQESCIGTCLKKIPNSKFPIQNSNYFLFFSNYNSLPENLSVKFQIKEIEANNAGIMHLGFDHLENCQSLDKIVMKNCVYIDDYAVEKLALRKDSLKDLEISSCKNITEHGLLQIKKLQNLQKLTLHDLPYVKDPKAVETELSNALKNCQFDFKIQV